MTAKPDILVRPYARPDFAACLSIFDTNAPEFFALPERAEFLAFLHDGPSTPYLVLEASGQVVAAGGVSASASGWATLDWGMVARFRQRSGLGRRLMSERIALARGLVGVKGLRLQTSQKTRGFYNRFGFTVSAVLADGFAPGLDCVTMQLGFQQSSPAQG